ncbi:phage tail assembly chaperone [Bordetella flabilis]|uniref:Phage tail assembly chaperone n=1 Tax=Bordetella flabilis TaxID=463014 RepID=A0A193GHK1_9BORD|nr:phage tail assembly chaperone [Bordetella flabilis]ANN78911.1 hypothetical protein BAU07_18890 [Bordetella flabilis]
MSFKVKADPTFDGTITIVGQGREQKLEVTFRHKTSTQYAELLAKMRDGDLDSSGLVLEILEKWDADVALDRAGVELLREHQPGADFAIINAYGEALAVARKKN